MRSLCSLALFAALGWAVVAAPVPKEKAEKPGPVTDEQLKQSQNNLKQILLAMHNYHDAMGAFPNNTTDKNGKPGLSWRVAILPYMEVDELYKQFKMDEGWDSENNKKLIEKLPKVYQPIRVKTKEKGMTFYQGFAGEGALFESGKKITLPGITDGTSNTIGVVEAGEPVIWTKPEDIPFDMNKDLPKLGGLFDGVFHAALCDGSVQRAKADYEARTLKAMITRNGGEVVESSGVFGK